MYIPQAAVWAVIAMNQSVIAAAATLPQNRKQQTKKNNTMQQIRTLILALVAMLVKATGLNRTDAVELKKLKEEFDAKSQELLELTATKKLADEAEVQEDADQATKDETARQEIEDLRVALEEALAAAAAVKPPTEENLADANASLGGEE